MVHQIFHKLGLRFFAVVETGKFRGLITKKSFVRYAQMLHHVGNGKDGETLIKGIKDKEAAEKEAVRLLDLEEHKKRVGDFDLFGFMGVDFFGDRGNIRRG